MTGLRELMRSSRLSEAKKKRLIVALTAGALAQGIRQLTRHRPARVSELINTISGEQYLSRA
jgi:hypothetical protein